MGSGYDGANFLDIIEYITIASTGNVQDFGDLTLARSGAVACSSPTRGVFGGGTAGGNQTKIDYITIATLGNAIDFGDRTQSKESLSGCSNGHGGYNV